MLAARLLTAITLLALLLAPLAAGGAPAGDPGPEGVAAGDEPAGDGDGHNWQGDDDGDDGHNWQGDDDGDDGHNWQGEAALAPEGAPTGAAGGDPLVSGTGHNWQRGDVDTA